MIFENSSSPSNCWPRLPIRVIREPTWSRSRPCIRATVVRFSDISLSEYSSVSLTRRKVAEMIIFCCTDSVLSKPPSPPMPPPPPCSARR